jgi:hypothetical protein
MGWNEWLRRVRHDLVKRLVWPARDRRDLGGIPFPGELAAKLIDDEGSPAPAEAVWAKLKAAAPSPRHADFAIFEAALAESVAAAQRDDIEGVLTLERAFDQLAQVLAKQER